MTIIALILNIIWGVGNGFVYYKNKPKCKWNLFVCMLHTFIVLLLIIKILK